MRSTLAFDSVMGAPWRRTARFVPTLEPAEPVEAAVVYPERGRYMTFDGNLLHGVLHPVIAGVQGEEGEVEDRVTLLVNYWLDKPPLQPYCVPLEQKEAAEMARASGWETLQRGGGGGGGAERERASMGVAAAAATAASTAEAAEEEEAGAATTATTTEPTERTLNKADIVTDGIESQSVTVQVSMPGGETQLVELVLPTGEMMREMEHQATWIGEMDVPGRMRRFLD